MYKKLSYKGITSTPKYSIDDHLIYGKLDIEPDVFLWDSPTVEGVEAAFKEAVDEYLRYCGTNDMTPYNGVLVLA